MTMTPILPPAKVAGPLARMLSEIEAGSELFGCAAAGVIGGRIAMLS